MASATYIFMIHIYPQGSLQDAHSSSASQYSAWDYCLPSDFQSHISSISSRDYRKSQAAYFSFPFHLQTFLRGISGQPPLLTRFQQSEPLGLWLGSIFVRTLFGLNTIYAETPVCCTSEFSRVPTLWYNPW
jgi:hypothetical protein